MTASSNWDIKYNNGNTFKPEKWAAVENNIWDVENHLVYEEAIVLKEHKLPNE